MSVHSPVAKPMRAATTLSTASVFDAAGATSATIRHSRAARRPGSHREAGATPWRTGMREVVLFLTFGLVVIYRPAHLATATV